MIHKLNKEQKKELAKILTTVFLLAVAVVFDHVLGKDLPLAVTIAIYAVPYLLISFEILKDAAVNIVHGIVFDEKFLMSIAGLGAFAVGEYPEAIMIITFYNVGELFERSAVESSRESIEDLLSLAPETANVIRGGKIITVNSEEVDVGETILVKAGERIPLDGTVISGSTELDTSALTGESVPVFVCEGNSVLSASISLTGAITVRVDKKYTDSTASVITRTVEEAIMQKPKVDRFITRFAKYYTPIVCVSAVIISVILPLILGEDIVPWLYRGLMLLVISCPCALVISVPLGFFISIGKAAKNGVLIKGCNTMETLKKVTVAVFDKTGTLTTGKFSIKSVCPVNTDEETLLSLAASIEKYSQHPIARAIAASSNSELEMDNVCEIKGKGITADHLGKRIIAGNSSLLEKNGVTVECGANDSTTVHIALDGEYLGYISVADTVKEDAAKTIDALKANGVSRTVMLTGDNISAAQTVAEAVGVDEYRAGLLPDEKLEYIRSIKSDGKKETLLFVGDGINDSPSLSVADIGIAMGSSGADIAIEVSDVVIMDDDLSKLAMLANLSKKTMNIIYFNIIFSLAVKILVFILSILGLSNMWFAIFADVGTLVLAILNCLRIRS